MDKEEQLYRREDPKSDRWKKSIHVLMGSKTNIDILSRDADHPQGNHPLRAQAKNVMKSLRPTETANAAKLLLSGIGQAEYINQIKAAQFLFSNLDFLKIDPDKLKHAFTSAVTEQTPVDNIKAVIETSEIIAPQLPDYNTKIAVRIAMNTIIKNVKHSPQYGELKESLPRPEKKPKIPPKKTVFDVTKLTEKDKRIIDSHHQGISHDEIARNEETSRGYIQNRISLLRGKGVSIERRTHAGSKAEIQNRRELIRDYTLEGLSGRDIIKKLKKQNIDVTPNQIRRYRATLRNTGELPQYRAN